MVLLDAGITTYTHTSSFHLNSNSVQKVHDQHPGSSFGTKGSSGAEGLVTYWGLGLQAYQHATQTRLGRCQVWLTPWLWAVSICQHYSYSDSWLPLSRWRLLLSCIIQSLQYFYNPSNYPYWQMRSLSYNPHKVTELSNWGKSTHDFLSVSVYGSVFFLRKSQVTMKEI